MRDMIRGRVARRRVKRVTASPLRPSGKSGEIVRCLEVSKAVSLDDLAQLTGWKAPTLRGVLSRLRARGHDIRREKQNDITIYRLERRQAMTAVNVRTTPQ